MGVTEGAFQVEGVQVIPTVGPVTLHPTAFSWLCRAGRVCSWKQPWPKTDKSGRMDPSLLPLQGWLGVNTKPQLPTVGTYSAVSCFFTPFPSQLP